MRNGPCWVSSSAMVAISSSVAGTPTTLRGRRDSPRKLSTGRDRANSICRSRTDTRPKSTREPRRAIGDRGDMGNRANFVIVKDQDWQQYYSHWGTALRRPGGSRRDRRYVGPHRDPHCGGGRSDLRSRDRRCERATTVGCQLPRVRDRSRSPARSGHQQKPRRATCGGGVRDRAGDRAPRQVGSSRLRRLRQGQRPSCRTERRRLPVTRWRSTLASRCCGRATTSGIRVLRPHSIGRYAARVNE
ncbi:MAG: hypothetical protein QOC69_6537 [Mycobacterium sp.]|nr:hypothetical protein [Mycobacterium sp.]